MPLDLKHLSCYKPLSHWVMPIASSLHVSAWIEFYCVLFHVINDYIMKRPIVGWLMNDKLQGMYKETVVT
jgi:hypothetical protein